MHLSFVRTARIFSGFISQRLRVPSGKGAVYESSACSSLHISQAALGDSPGGAHERKTGGKQQEKQVRLYCQVEGRQPYVVAILRTGARDQVGFTGLMFVGKRVRFFHSGAGVIHITGVEVHEEERRPEAARCAVGFVHAGSYQGGSQADTSDDEEGWS
eukprot:jgi/Mesvir1/15480/Mv20018-RA.1